MTPSEPDQVSLEQALHAYVEARAGALLTARKALHIGELDARALLFIVDRPGTRPSELGDYLGITSAGVTTLTDRLVQHDAIRRDSDDEDRRVVRLTATVDFDVEPWSALTRFDEAVLGAIESGDRAAMDRAATVIAALTEVAAGR